jgi:hypothetical protein
MITLDDLKPRVVTVTVEIPHGEPLVIPLRSLSYHEWLAIGTEVSEPPVPKTRVGDDGRPAPNPLDPDYVKQRDESYRKRSYMRLAAALVGGGMSLPGETLAEQGAALEGAIDAGIANALLDYLISTVNGGRARIEQRAETFHGGRTAADADASGARLDTGNVGGASRRRKR